MHGLSIMSGLLGTVIENAATRGIAQVELIRIAAGDLSGVSAEELRFAFTLVARGTVLENAVLRVESVPGSREVKVVFSGTDEDQASLVDVVYRYDLRLLGMTEKGADIEKLYMNLTKGEKASVQ